MQFKHPELLYALFLLIIPIIVHLFQLRRFQKVAFTNVEFLKNVNLQTRKSSQIKKWLILTTRLLLLAAIILAFAQPYFSKTNSLNKSLETVIYLDNSFSMQAKGAKGELLKRAVQDIITSSDDAQKITLFTNNETYRNTTANSIKNELLQLDYASSQLDYSEAVLKGKSLFSKNNSTIKNLIIVSDFQQTQSTLQLQQDSLINVHLVQLKPNNLNNTSIDSVYISKATAANIEITATVKNTSSNVSNDISVSLYDNDNLLAKSSATKTNNYSVQFTLPNNQIINGKLSIDDPNLLFDNTLYFNINAPSKINVLAINNSDDNYLKRVFTDDEFNYTSSTLDQLNFNLITDQNLIVLNELTTINNALSNSITSYIDNGGGVLIIPSEKSTLTTYNQLLKTISTFQIDSITNVEKLITTINYAHPIFKDVFDKQVSNFQYPKTNSYFALNTSNNTILNFEDSKPFLSQSGNVFLFSSALNSVNSNFINSPLIVPTLYNIGRQSLKHPKLYFTIGDDNTYDIDTQLQSDHILKLYNTSLEFIPQQQTFSNKVTITTTDLPNIAEIYQIVKNTDTIKNISYNYSRKESLQNYYNLSQISNLTVQNSVPEVFNTIKSDTNIDELWKWFVIFALIFLGLEMLILKFFK
ncbi:BatA domain-containing protein [Pontimicrobium sp. IMCC45349]|uniref:BatA domain-containing protein n=1 Tax=Pontimicrobium sp. IMCC45349 TaxID=3391574 RepID=UPI0039A0C6C4